jgi:hypothetical protein
MGKLILGLGIFPLLVSSAWALANHPTHETLVEYAATKAGLLEDPLYFTSLQINLLHQGASNEDVPDSRCLAHAWNPLTDVTFRFGDATARDAAGDRWNHMAAAFAAANFYGGDDSGAWHFLGRASHLLQDMSSPLHVFALWHAGIPLGVNPTCQFEAYWEANDTALRGILDSTTGGPLHSSVLPPEAGEKMDAFSWERLGYHFTNSCPHKDSDDVRGWLEVLGWASYLRSTFWGEIYYEKQEDGPATTPYTTAANFTDGSVDSKPNTLHTMFNGKVRRIYDWWENDDYFEITDRLNHVFYFKKYFYNIDDWGACGQIQAGCDGLQEGSRIFGPAGSDYDDVGARTIGRFWFDLRELGKDSSNPYCYPPYHPDGTPMTEHIHEYLGKHLLPLAMRYNAGLLGLANRRVTVKTADATPATGFSWSRMDNFGNGPSFSAGSGGSNFYFVAKSSVSLTAPTANTGGGSFVRWLRNGAPFLGNSTPTITINDSALPIPTNGVAYTAEYSTGTERPLVTIGRPDESNIVISWPSGTAVLQESTDLRNWTNCASQANPQTVTTALPCLFFRLLVVP